MTRLSPVHRKYILALSFRIAIFGLTGSRLRILQNWSIIDRLRLVRIPVLIVNGRKDIAQDYVVKPLFDGIPKVRWVTFGDSSHTPHMEERERFMKLASEFLL